MPRLIVNADDFGWSRDVNEGIVYCHRNGILTATTMMAGAPAFDDAVGLAHATPSLDIGVHLTLLHTPAVRTGRPLPSDIPGLLRQLALGRIDVYEEFAAQVNKIVAAGIQPTHLDTHKHTHVLPAVASAVARIVRDFGIRWVRMPFDFAGPLPVAARLMRTQIGSIRRKLSEAGARTTDQFTGFAATGFLDESRLQEIVETLPEGTTELMCHPGFLRDELSKSRTRLKQSREVELRALTSKKVREALQRRGISLANYRDTI